MGQKVTQQYMGAKDPRPTEISGVACTITHPPATSLTRPLCSILHSGQCHKVDLIISMNAPLLFSWFKQKALSLEGIFQK